jgi:uncharacterized membrane protein
VIGTILQVIFFLLVPAGALWLERRVRVVAVMGSVALCYVIGFAVGNTPGIPVDSALALELSTASVALAIPLLLFSLDFRGWLRQAPQTLLAFFWVVVAVCMATAIARPIFAERVAESAKVAGMLVGVYTGGTPNLAAVGKALGVSNETFVMVNAADVLVSAPYFLFLITIGPGVFGRILAAPITVDRGGVPAAEGIVRPLHVLAGLGLALVCVATGLAVSRFSPPGVPEEAVAILAITTTAIGLSFLPRIRALQGTFEAGNYILLVFCVTIGTIADFGEVIRSSGWIIAYVAVVIFTSLLLHVALCRLTGIDRDTTVITSTAALFGPAFIGPVSVRLGNRAVFVSGLMSGLVGYAVGNYLGLFVAWMLS